MQKAAAFGLIGLVVASLSPSASAFTDACSLLSDHELESVQGERPITKKPTVKEGEGLIVSGCYFTMATASKSVLIDVNEASKKKPTRDPRRLWRELFSSEKGEIRERARRAQSEREEEPSAPPEPIRGLGESAYWEGAGPIGGTLHVLTGHRFFSISVGGPGSPRDKRDHSKTLARFLLARLAKK